MIALGISGGARRRSRLRESDHRLGELRLRLRRRRRRRRVIVVRDALERSVVVRALVLGVAAADQAPALVVPAHLRAPASRSAARSRGSPLPIGANRRRSPDLRRPAGDGTTGRLLLLLPSFLPSFSKQRERDLIILSRSSALLRSLIDLPSRRT